MWKSQLFPDDGPNDWTICERSIDLEPGHSCNVVRVAEADMPPFRPGTLLVPDDVAPHFEISSMQWGPYEQMAVPSMPVPAAMFDSRQPFTLDGPPLLELPVILPAVQITMVVRNTSDATRAFSAKLRGWFVRPLEKVETPETRAIVDMIRKRDRDRSH